MEAKIANKSCANQSQRHELLQQRKPKQHLSACHQFVGGPTKETEKGGRGKRQESLT